jgi:hypothetical protein
MLLQQAINEKSLIKVDLQIAEKKIKRKEEKLEELERQLQMAREKYQAFQSIIAKMREEFVKVSIDANRLISDQKKA